MNFSLKTIKSVYIVLFIREYLVFVHTNRLKSDMMAMAESFNLKSKTDTHSCTRAYIYIIHTYRYIYLRLSHTIHFRFELRANSRMPCVYCCVLYSFSVTDQHETIHLQSALFLLCLSLLLSFLIFDWHIHSHDTERNVYAWRCYEKEAHFYKSQWSNTPKTHPKTLNVWNK